MKDQNKPSTPLEELNEIGESAVPLFGSEVDSFTVEVLNGTFSHKEREKGAVHILNNVNMQVPHDSVYALLGPSGCGKTTLLKVITGRISLSSGSVCLFGKPLTEISIADRSPLIGYMPQELAQYSQFTIEETVSLYGKLHGLTQAQIKKRLDYLVKLLGLPPKHKKVGNTSGGQQRRISLASALVHNPPLLLLDEPTVGVDPVLRLKIWRYLNDLTTSQGTTVIISTHYTEEAKLAAKVGLMRLGEIILEETPQKLMDRMQTSSLETCFLRLCASADSKEDENVKETEPDGAGNITKRIFLKAYESLESLHSAVIHRTTSTHFKNVFDTRDDTERLETSQPKVFISDSRRNQEPLKTVNCFPLKLCSKHSRLSNYTQKVKSILWRNILFSRKNFPLLIFQVLIPFATVNLISLSVGTKLFDVPIGLVVDEDPLSLSQVFIDTIDNRTIQIHRYHNYTEGIEAVKRAEVKGLIHISHNFTECLLEKLDTGLKTNGYIVDCSSVKTYFDMTNSIVLQTIQHNLLNSYKKFLNEILQDQDHPVDITRFPLEVSEDIYGLEEVPFSHYILPGAMVTLSFYMPLLATLFTFILEKKSGLQDRLRVCGVTLNQILTSQFITQTLIVLVQVPLLLTTPILFFDLPHRGSFFLTYFLLTLQGIVGLTFGFFISSITSNGNVAIMIVLATLYSNMNTTGFLWPLEGMPSFLRRLVYFLPITIPIEAQRAIMCRGWTIAHRTIYMGIVASLSWTAIFLIFTMVMLKLKND